MTGKIVRYPDPERKSKHADAVDRDLADSAIIIVLPIIRIERFPNVESPKEVAEYLRKIRAEYVGMKRVESHNPVRRKARRRET